MSLSGFAENASVVDRSARGKLRAVGGQAEWFLGQLVTNHIEECAPGAGCEALLLTPKGRILHHMRIVAAAAGDLWVDSEPGSSPALYEFLSGRIFATRVELEDVTGDYAILSVLGPRADEAAEAVVRSHPGLVPGLPGGNEHDGVFGPQGGAVRVVRPADGLDLWVPAEAAGLVKVTLRDAGVAEASDADYRALRIAAGLPEIGVDFGDRHLPQEAALERAVHFKKGCYLGQEAVAMAQRGKVKRRLRHLHFKAEAAEGEAFAGEVSAGQVTSAAVAGGRGYGIGMIAASVEPGSEVAVGEARLTAVVAELPGTDTGPHLPSARELRERLQGLPSRPGAR